MVKNNRIVLSVKNNCCNEINHNRGKMKWLPKKHTHEYMNLLDNNNKNNF